jgi:hypothetical protein
VAVFGVMDNYINVYFGKLSTVQENDDGPLTARQFEEDIRYPENDKISEAFPIESYER